VGVMCGGVVWGEAGCVRMRSIDFVMFTGML
jgi:hypothetical protein